MHISKNKITTILALTISLVLISILVVDLMPLLKQVIQSTNNESKMIEYIKSYGAKGVPIIIGLQFLQVLIPFFPASPVQILAGLCYGVWIGTLLCLIGFLSGHLLIFYAARKLGNTILPYLKNKSSSKKTHFLSKFSSKSLEHPENMVFILYLIPFFPNGMLPFVFSQTTISYKKYIVYMAAATVPSTFICALLGSKLASGDYQTALVVACIFIVFLLIMLIFKNKIMNAETPNRSQS